ncbi:ATP-dependent DNA helicase RecG [Actinobacteria bacterium YIM 96077]|uniref:Probable DNA 3'-5' helicase RecG n=1 Tax=Phytoactinopolyspora halophila TaxID=1981511 RepID=A0A329QDV2_9ACTN|nr:ATP-dependent DNA helicase RecG [Phytoactinopolyspora halophila]AYY12701.1 ATP-dependent DNA helicase RecG [Actinobacteria bacterium YIM 96077]RAW10615.1 ATP-dependent DNA helicase RecG [Phytoactinopolyspora halophila]
MVELHWDLDVALGDKTAKTLAKELDLHTVEDLLRYYPRRYIERGELTELDSLEEGEQVTVLAKVKEVHKRSMRSRRGSIVEAVVTDGTGELKLTFFNQPWHEEKLQPERLGMFAGKVSTYRGVRQLAHPDYKLFVDEDTDVRSAAELYAEAIIPVYRATQRLASWRIEKCVRTLLDQLSDVPDPVPDDVLRRHRMPGLAETFHAVHRPADRQRLWQAQARLRFEEAFVLQTELARRRASTAALPATPRRSASGGVLEALDAQLPFELTRGQRQVGDMIAADLGQEHPMHRLLQGEVGAGKTVVALRAMLAVVDSGGQAALLAPTEVLAQQHYHSLMELLGPLGQRGMLGGLDIGTRVALVTGSMGAAARKEALLDIGVGDAGIVVGTHALLEEQVQFFDLGLVVIDEQHRFGVEQRAALTAKSRDETRPHVLVMTATPIPRTVAMTVFGDLEISTLSEIPAGRADVATHVVPVQEKPHYLERAWQRVREEAEAGRGVYIVCPRIGGDVADDADGGGGTGGDIDDDAVPAASAGDPDDDLSDTAHTAGTGGSAGTGGTGGSAGTAGHVPGDASSGGESGSGRQPIAVLELAEMLREGPLEGIEVEVLHGRLGPEAKEAAMRRFASGTRPVLVATTVVEVGVDVPTASTMVIMDADRFGVSQLHQLRGRIGRGSVPGLCLLVTDSPAGTPARERLDAVAASRNGFELARVDLEQRREGDVLGATQSGRRSSLKFLRVIRDEDVIREAREDAVTVVSSDPELREHPELDRAISAFLASQDDDYMDKA